MNLKKAKILRRKARALGMKWASYTVSDKTKPRVIKRSRVDGGNFVYPAQVILGLCGKKLYREMKKAPYPKYIDPLPF